MIDLQQGDCLELIKSIPDKSVDMILCDLPYGKLNCEWDKAIPLEPLWEQYERIIKKFGAILLFSNGVFTYKLINSNFKLFKYKWIWIKNTKSNFINAKNRPMTNYEEISVFSKGSVAHKGNKNRMNYNPQDLIQIDKTIKVSKSAYNSIAGDRPSNKSFVIQKYTNYPCDVLNYNCVIKPFHPSQKPVPLLEYLIKTYTLEGDTVLDNCMGSGSTGVACVNTNRNFIGMELDEHYFEVAQNRIYDAVKNKEQAG